ncbi:multidrug efflux pump-associated protein, AcrZ family, partial [Salmonella enterica subsp. enterica serovar Heidelberg]|nr:multidrug efflux pump-associated protein, AcrZ family [Salmonella enterica subsp. enterica serovar Heidelberg]
PLSRAFLLLKILLFLPIFSVFNR